MLIKGDISIWLNADYEYMIMPIQPIVETTWPEILSLQEKAYLLVEPESLDVLKDKWSRSPSSCFIYRDGEQLMGYLLAHAWNKDRPPKLFQKLPEATNGNIMFLHDLAVADAALGKGIGSKLINHLVKVAALSGYKKIRLVAVQNSRLFWQKHGFTPVDISVCESYGADARLMQREVLV